MRRPPVLVGRRFQEERDVLLSVSVGLVDVIDANRYVIDADGIVKELRIAMGRRFVVGLKHVEVRRLRGWSDGGFLGRVPVDLESQLFVKRHSRVEIGNCDSDVVYCRWHGVPRRTLRT